MLCSTQDRAPRVAGNGFSGQRGQSVQTPCSAIRLSPWVFKNPIKSPHRLCTRAGNPRHWPLVPLLNPMSQQTLEDHGYLAVQGACSPRRRARVWFCSSPQHPADSRPGSVPSTQETLMELPTPGFGPDPVPGSCGYLGCEPGDGSYQIK